MAENNNDFQEQAPVSMTLEEYTRKFGPTAVVQLLKNLDASYTKPQPPPVVQTNDEDVSKETPASPVDMHDDGWPVFSGFGFLSKKTDAQKVNKHVSFKHNDKKSNKDYK